MTMTRYPQYKASGEDWLGEIPAHWDVKRLKQICEIYPSNVDKKSYEGEPPVLLCNYTDVYYNETITEQIKFMLATATPEQINKFSLKAGDTIITKDSESANDIAIAAYVPEDLPNVICGYHLAMVRPLNDTCGAFIKRFFDSRYAKACFEVQANGLTRVGLGQYALNNTQIPVPPPEEQQAIANFLDHETAKLDALVAEQRRLIDLLKEKRQAVISHAVTQGLNPHAPMRPSGIAWLGQVPAHWEVGPFRRGIAFLTDYEANGSFADTKSNVLLDQGEAYAWYVRATDLENNRYGLQEENRFCDQKTYQFLSKTALYGNELLITKRGEIGKIYLMPHVECPATLAPNLYLLKLNSTFKPVFAYYWFISAFGRPQLELANKSTTIGALYKNDVRELICSFPPPEEQTAIAAFLDQETAKIDTLVAEAESAIGLMQERRTALISAAVTGKIDVRNRRQTVELMAQEEVFCGHSTR